MRSDMLFGGLQLGTHVITRRKRKAATRMAVYHEKQELYRCGIHALNNALQGTIRHSQRAAHTHLCSCCQF